MQRDPSIHITRSALLAVLNRLGVEQAEALASELLRASVRQRLTSRSQVTTKAKTAARITEAGDGYADLFSTILFQERTRANHVAIKPIRKGTPDHGMLADVALLAQDFCTAFGLPQGDGFRWYIRAGLSLMRGKYGLGKFKYYDRAITERRLSQHTLETDSDPEGTALVFSAYQKALSDAGVPDAHFDAEAMAHFVWARLEADDADAPYAQWVEAQFARLAFLNAVPNPPQLYGENALKRYLEWSRENAVQQHLEKPVRRMSEEEAAYFQKARREAK